MTTVRGVNFGWMEVEICYRDQNRFLYQAVNMFISAVKLGILTWWSMGIDSLLEPHVVIQGTAVFGTSALTSFFRFLLASDSLMEEKTSC